MSIVWGLRGLGCTWKEEVATFATVLVGAGLIDYRLGCLE